jgi:hypothetical protein
VEHDLQALEALGQELRAAARRLPLRPPGGLCTGMVRKCGSPREAVYSRKLIRFHDLPLPKETHPWR